VKRGCDQGHQGPAHAGRGANAQTSSAVARALGDQAARLVQIFENAVRTLAQDFAGRGQTHEFVGANDQFGAQFALKDPNLLAYR